MLSVIIPSYNEEEGIALAADAIGGVLRDAGISYEMIFVDDGSKDGTWDAIERAASEKPCIRGIAFSRNFGKESAIIAGLMEAKGDCAAVIDCDLQHPPEKLVEMYRMWEAGYEIVEGRKSDRGKEGIVRSAAAKVFYSIISRAAGFDMANASDFKLLDRKAVDVLINMRERNAFFRALSSWIGFKTGYVEFSVKERTVGTSKWSTGALVRYAANNISSFSTVPMQIVTVLGVVMLIVSVVLGGIAFVEKICGKALEGFTTVILIQLFSSSIIMLSLGIIGYYIAKIYEEVKGRPRYVVSKTVNKDERKGDGEK